MNSTLSNTAGWTPLEDAVITENRSIARKLFDNHSTALKLEFQRCKPLLKQTLRSIPNFRVNLKWEFNSFLFGRIVKKVSISAEGSTCQSWS